MGDSVPRITEIRAIPLNAKERGGKLDTSRNQYTLIKVRTDAGLTGIGSSYTSTELVRAALGLGLRETRPAAPERASGLHDPPARRREPHGIPGAGRGARIGTTWGCPRSPA